MMLMSELKVKSEKLKFNLQIDLVFIGRIDERFHFRSNFSLLIFNF